MDLKLKNLNYLVTRANSGLGRTIVKTLLENEDQAIITARDEEKLEELKRKFSDQTTIIVGNIIDSTFLAKLKNTLPVNLYGVFINAGGPKAATIPETTMEDWENAYKLVL